MKITVSGSISQRYGSADPYPFPGSATHTGAWSIRRRARRRPGVPAGPEWTLADASRQRTSGLWTLCPAARAEQAQSGPFSLFLAGLRIRVHLIRIQGFNDQKFIKNHR